MYIYWENGKAENKQTPSGAVCVSVRVCLCVERGGREVTEDILKKKKKKKKKKAEQNSSRMTYLFPISSNCEFKSFVVTQYCPGPALPLQILVAGSLAGNAAGNHCGGNGGADRNN